MRKFYKIHKWIAVAIGVFIFAQALTGAVWVGPNPLGVFSWKKLKVPSDSDVALVSPLQVTRELGDIQQVALRWLPETPVYEVALATGEARLFDARDGAPFEVGEELAVRVALHAMGGDGGPQVARTTRLTEPDLDFMGGPFPAYRVEMADAGSTYVHVAEATGRIVSVGNRWDRTKGVFVAVHDWAILWLWTGSEGLTRYGMILAGFVACLAALSGYYLALPKRWRLRKKPRAGGAAPPPPSARA